MSNQRNQPCPCGSGKKFKRCCEGRKPVSTTLTIDCGVPTVVTGVRFGNGGRVEFLQGDRPILPQRAWVGTHRERAKGEKALLKLPVQPNEMRFGELNGLLQYDTLFGIDTNTRNICGTTVSVSCVMQLRFRRCGMDLVSETAVLGAFELHNVNGPPENVGWSLLQGAVISSQDYRLGQRVAILTDSDLGNHAAYNDRTKPICHDSFLREEIKLIYAFDKGRGVANEVVRSCDREADLMLRSLDNGSIDIATALEVIDGPCSHARAWINNNSKFLTERWFRLGQHPLQFRAKRSDTGI